MNRVIRYGAGYQCPNCLEMLEQIIDRGEIARGLLRLRHSPTGYGTACVNANVHVKVKIEYTPAIPYDPNAP